MSYNLIVTTVAEQQTDDACNYYEEQQAGLAERFLSELYDTYLKIADHPEYYGIISPNDELRDIKLHSFPYVVIYEIQSNDVIVIAVFNTYRKPLR